MKIEEAIPYLEKITGKPFGELIQRIPDLRLDKGKTGKLLESLIGLPPSNTLRDFENGELKTNKANEIGKPLETMFIMQISKEFDNIIQNLEFKGSRLYKKICRCIYVPVCKVGEVEDWYFHPHIYWSLDDDLELLKIISDDYCSIIKQIQDHISNSPDGYIHTSSGKFIQIRTKDAKPYNPIYSHTYRKYVSNKNFAFYFKKEFMAYLQIKNDYKPWTSHNPKEILRKTIFDYF